VAHLLRDQRPHAVILIGRGSSAAAALYARYLFETENGLLTSIAEPSVSTLYGSPLATPGTCLVAISQSGRGEDLIHCIRSARHQGAQTVAIVNDVSPPLASEAQHVLSSEAGTESCVPATKSLCGQMTVLALLSKAVHGKEDPLGAQLPDALTLALALRQRAQELAHAFVSARPERVAVLGRGFSLPVARELALKLKECAQIPAEAFSAADFRHGPLALVDPQFHAVLVDVGGKSSAVNAAAKAIGEQGGRVWHLISDALPDALPVPTSLKEAHRPIVATLLAQLFAFEVALARGLNPSAPRGLGKVTSTF
jgi:glucosamine--fructose-6-phosphate aminotransferase (isomerizing)